MASRIAQALVAIAALVASVDAPPADAARPLVTGFNEPGYRSTSAAHFLLGRTLHAKARFVRINVNWHKHVSDPPADPTDPADPAYNFAVIDRAVKRAASRKLNILLNVRSAPRFAEGKNRPPRAPRGTWKPAPSELRKFAIAVATRYSGNFPDPEGSGRLPYVTHYQAWNEWGGEVWLTPAYRKGEPFSPNHYRKMSRAFYQGIKSVHRRSIVVSGGTNPSGCGRGCIRGRGGDPTPFSRRIPPLRALRDLFCLSREGLKPLRGCGKPAQFDAIDHHAINTKGNPWRGADHPDDVLSGDFAKIRDTVRAAERAGHLKPPGRRSLWVTESWFESDPPDPKRGVPLRKQARWVQLNLYVLWKQGAKYVFNIQVRDTPIDKSRPVHSLQGGLLFANSRPKPAYKAFRFPFVGDRKSRRRVLIWGKAPRTGRLRIQVRRDGGWRKIKRIGVSNNKTFQTRVRLPRKPRPYKLRGRVGSEQSLVWRQR